MTSPALALKTLPFWSVMTASPSTMWTTSSLVYCQRKRPAVHDHRPVERPPGRSVSTRVVASGWPSITSEAGIGEGARSWRLPEPWASGRDSTRVAMGALSAPGRNMCIHSRPVTIAAEVNAFTFVGGALAVWAVVLAGLGVLNHNFPPKGLEKVIIAISAILVVGAIATAIGSSGEEKPKGEEQAGAKNRTG